MFFLIIKRGNHNLYASIKDKYISFSINPIDATLHNKNDILKIIKYFNNYNFKIESDIIMHIIMFFDKKYYFSKKHKKFIFCCNFNNEKYILNNFNNIKKEIHNFYLIDKLLSNSKPLIKINNFKNYYISRNNNNWYIFSIIGNEKIEYKSENLDDILNFFYNKIKDCRNDLMLNELQNI